MWRGRKSSCDDADGGEAEEENYASMDMRLYFTMFELQANYNNTKQTIGALTIIFCVGHALCIEFPLQTLKLSLALFSQRATFMGLSRVCA
jgi:hypothetical protein